MRLYMWIEMNYYCLLYESGAENVRDRTPENYKDEQRYGNEWLVTFGFFGHYFYV